MKEEDIMNIPVTRSCGNIFLDIGFSPEEAAELTAKSEMIRAISQTIEKRKLTQKKAADICHTDQPTLSKILRGRMESVTIEKLASWLTSLGRSVEIHVMPYNARTKIGKFTAFSGRKNAKKN